MNASLIHFSAIATDVGQGREVNEDACADVALADGRLIVVADGMGGHEAGDVASRIVVEEVERHFSAAVGAEPRDLLYDGIERAHDRILAHGAETGTADMGSTVVVCFIRGREVWTAWVGDSRLYWFSGGSLVEKTRDHTRVQRMLDAGILTEEEAKHHPDANVITRAVGHFPKDGDGVFKPDVPNDPLLVNEGDSIVLCSDGLFDLVDDPEIAQFIADCDAEAGCRKLVDSANERGGHDNITVAVVHFGRNRGAPAPRPAPQARIPTDPIGSGSRPEVEVSQVPEAPTSPRRTTEPDAPKPDAPNSNVSPSAGQGPIVIVLAVLVVLLGGAVVYLLAREPVVPPPTKATPEVVVDESTKLRLVVTPTRTPTIASTATAGRAQRDAEVVQ